MVHGVDSKMRNKMKVKLKETKWKENEERRQSERRTQARKRFIAEAPPPEIQFVWDLQFFKVVKADFVFFCATENCRQ